MKIFNDKDLDIKLTSFFFYGFIHYLLCDLLGDFNLFQGCIVVNIEIRVTNKYGTHGNSIAIRSV